MANDSEKSSIISYVNLKSDPKTSGYLDQIFTIIILKKSIVRRLKNSV
ncbi:hypothetical protein A33Q_4630 [Indibacter alkaliphilus LW1]|uniref:Uncharacterized protein n=1 Tax=Indibacter alkaliphilus (strain CCUG 57479 / KCTC 22604 / LW1) TaxID=1189612 RepID=S2CWQ2_INDAL|nr:hypothetical protein A33Q_4630 [Indibacter alkaliphilus LW1]